MYVLPVLLRPAIIVRFAKLEFGVFNGSDVPESKSCAGYRLCTMFHFSPTSLFVILATIREPTPKTTFQLAYVSFCNRSHQIPFPLRSS